MIFKILEICWYEFAGILDQTVIAAALLLQTTYLSGMTLSLRRVHRRAQVSGLAGCDEMVQKNHMFQELRYNESICSAVWRKRLDCWKSGEIWRSDDDSSDDSSDAGSRQRV